MAQEKKRVGNQAKIAIGFAVLLIIAFLIIWLAPVMTAAYTISVPYQDTETYYENEPYQDTETYNVDEPYQVQVEKNLTYSVTNSSASASWDLSRGCYAYASVTLLNTDTSPGTFTVSFTFPTLNRTYTDSDTGYIFPSESKTLTGIADTDCGEDWNWRYNVTPGTKMVTETQYKPVEHQRLVTKYRQVEHQRLVTKERLETRYKKVAVLDYLVNY
jgi:hypothetical protein